MKNYIYLIAYGLFGLFTIDSHADLNNGLVAYYPFNGNANDESGNGHHGVVKGPKLTSDNQGKHNQAYRFDGIDDYIEISDNDQLDMGFSDYSISVWVKTVNPTNNGRIFSKGSSGCITGYMLRMEGERIHLENAADQLCQVFLPGQQSIADNQWHFIVVVVNREQGGFIYIDGQLDSSQKINTSKVDFSNNRNAWIGRNDVQAIEAFNGVIDELRLYNRTLSVTEIQALYQLQPSSPIIAQVTESSNQVIIASSVSQITTTESTQQTAAFAIVTPIDTETQVVTENTRLAIEPETVLLVHPPIVETAPDTTQPVSTLIRGNVQPKVACNDNNDFILRAVLADIIAECSNLRATTEATEFHTSYNQNGLLGQLNISVISGSVSVTDRNNQNIVLTAGSEQSSLSINAKVPRTTWVLPIENDRIIGGRENLLVWTAYPNAAGYILEYNLPEPVFSETNAEVLEFEHQSIRLSSNDYEIFDDMVLFRIFIGNNQSVPVQGRVFALDATGDIMLNSTSSDSVQVTWE